MGLILTTSKRLERMVRELMVQKSSSWGQVWLRAAESTFNGDEVSNPYTQHTWVYAAIRRRAENVAQVPFKIYREGEEVTDGPVVQLFRKPNPHMSRFELWEATVTYLDLRGWCLWYLLPSVGRQTGLSRIPAGIQVLNPELCRPVRGADGGLTGWVYGGIPLKLEEVVRFRYFHPTDDVLGLTPIKAASISIESDYQAVKYGRAFFRNAASPGGVLETDQVLSDDQYKRLLAQWEARHGGADKAHRIALLEGGLKYHQISLSQEDMQFIEQRRLNREEILAIYGVPKALVGVTDDLNYATHEGQKKVFWHDTIEPLLERIEEQLEKDFFERIAPDLQGLFDRSSVPEFEEDISTKVDMAYKLWSMGVPFNVINERLELGFDALPGGDTGYIPLGVMPTRGSPISAVVEESARRKDVRDDGIRDLFVRRQSPHEARLRSKLSRYFFEQRKRVLGMINPKAARKDMPENWEDELNSLFDQEKDRLVELTRPALLQALAEGYRTAKELGVDVAFNLQDPSVLDWLRERENLIRGIGDDVFGQVMDLIESGLADGQTTAEIADALREMYNDFGGPRASTIARTETAGAINAGQLDAYRKAGVQKKRWITARDEKVRTSHLRAEADGAIPMDRRFSNGLMAPHDRGAPAAEVINCRCTLAPVVETEG